MKGQHWVRLLPLVLLIVVGLTGLRGLAGTPHWDGPLHRRWLEVGLALEVLFVILFEVTRRRPPGPPEAVARKLRSMLLAVLGSGMAAVALAMLAGLQLHLFTSAPRKQAVPRPPTAPLVRPRTGGNLVSTLHLLLTIALYVLAAAALLAAIAVILWLARRPGAGPKPWPKIRDDAFVAEDSEDLRDAVESGLSALRMVDGARAAIIACYLAMEGRLAERGATRGLADTPDELLARARASGLVRGTAAPELTALFYEARFSSHPLGRGEREVAEQALDELAAALAPTRIAARLAGIAGPHGAIEAPGHNGAVEVPGNNGVAGAET